MAKASAGRLIYAASETDADILYPTGFFAPDPFLFVQKGRTRILVMSDLEMDRARSQATVDRVLSWSGIAAPLEKGGRRAPAADVIARVLRLLGLRRVSVPRSFPLGLAQELRPQGNPARARSRAFLAGARAEGAARGARDRGVAARRGGGPAGGDRGAQILPHPRRLARARRTPLHAPRTCARWSTPG